VTRFEYPQYVDLGQLMQRVAATATFSASARSAATAVVAAVRSAVFARMADERQTSGMSVYFPTATTQEMPEVTLYTEWNSSTGWSRVVNRALGRAANARGGGAGGLWAFAERRKWAGDCRLPSDGAWPEPPPRERAVEAQRTRSERRPVRRE
jgi:hypothetical protein